MLLYYSVCTLHVSALQLLNSHHAQELKLHLAGAQCRCSADESLVGVVVHVWGAGGQARNRDPAEEEEQHEAASSEEAHDRQSDEDPRVLLRHEPERNQKTNTHSHS